MKPRKVYLFEIQITDNSSVGFGYEQGGRIVIPIESSSEYNAHRVFTSNFWGSEYPDYVLERVTECDNKGLFAPILHRMDVETKRELRFYQAAFSSCLDYSGFSELTKMHIREAFQMFGHGLSWKKIFKNKLTTNI